MRKSNFKQQRVSNHDCQVITEVVSTSEMDLLSQQQKDSDPQTFKHKSNSFVWNSSQDLETDRVSNIYDRDQTKKSTLRISSDRQLGQLLSNLLKYGVLFSSAIVLTGGILYLIHHGGETVDYHFFQGEPDIFSSPQGVVSAVLSGNSRALVQLGLLLLIATPIVRVTISLFAFLWQRDSIYAIVTFLVLSGLAYGIIGAYCY